MTSVISTIIVNYNAGALLRDCVYSLLNTPMEIEIIVVDNASTDGSLDLLDDFERVRIIRSSVNAGFAAACNKGARVASAPFLLFLNPDCSFTPDALVILLQAMGLDERVGMVGGLLVHPDGTEQAGGRRSIPTPLSSFVRAFGLTILSRRWPRLFPDFHLDSEPLPAHAIEVEAISGACMLVRRNAMADVGEWDDGYFLHCEDLDWCKRFGQKGWKILFVPSAKITHALGACGKSRPVFVEWHKHKGMVRFYRKFYQDQCPRVLLGLVEVGVWLRFCLVVIFHAARRAGRTVGLGRG